MPRYRTQANLHLDRYVAAIEDELRSSENPPPPPSPNLIENASGKPVIIESPTGIGGRVRVLVIWDEWSSLPIEDRNRVILEAYRRVLRDESGNISLTLGLTTQQHQHLTPGSDWLVA